MWVALSFEMGFPKIDQGLLPSSSSTRFAERKKAGELNREGETTERYIFSCLGASLKGPSISNALTMRSTFESLLR